MNKIKVLIVDDSALVRQSLSSLLVDDPQIEIMGMVSNPFAAADIMKTTLPDVMILDIEMPKMDGLTFLKKIMSQNPIPVIICSTLAEAGSEIAFRAMKYGAVEIITKPKIGTKDFFEESRIIITDTVKAAAQSVRKKAIPEMKIEPKLTADVIIPKSSVSFDINTTDKVVVVGASTGGTEALRVFLEKVPVNFPGILIVQHMPENFTKSFAERLDSLCSIKVKEASNGDPLLPGQALISPGNRHAVLKRSGAKYYVEIVDGPLVSRHRPSVDVLFRSAAKCAGKNAIGVIMTGMGDDGANGMLEMKEQGAFTIAQDEKSCVVFGMPAEAVKRGGVNKVVALDEICSEIIRQLK